MEAQKQLDELKEKYKEFHFQNLIPAVAVEISRLPAPYALLLRRFCLGM
jgi:hypothetical protein